MPFLFIGIPLAVILILNIFKWKNYRTAFWVALGVALFQMGLACFDLYRCLFDQPVIQSTFFGKLSIDLFSAVVLLIIGFIGFVAVIVAMNTEKSSRFSFGSVTILLMMGMSGDVMVTDIFSLYVFIEVTAAASFLLIAIEKEESGLEGAFKYYLMSAVATTMMLIAIALEVIAHPWLAMLSPVPSVRLPHSESPCLNIGVPSAEVGNVRPPLLV